MITYEVKEEIRLSLTAEAREIVEKGSPEAKVWAALPADSGTGKAVEELRTTLGAEVLKIGQGQAFKKKWVKKLPDGTFARDPSSIDKIVDTSRLDLEDTLKTGRAPHGDEKKATELRKRGLLETV